MSAGYFNGHRHGLQNTMMHVYAIFANCMKSHSDLFP